MKREIEIENINKIVHLAGPFIWVIEEYLASINSVKASAEWQVCVG